MTVNVTMNYVMDQLSPAVRALLRTLQMELEKHSRSLRKGSVSCGMSLKGTTLLTPHFADYLEVTVDPLPLLLLDTAHLYMLDIA